MVYCIRNCDELCVLNKETFVQTNLSRETELKSLDSQAISLAAGEFVKKSRQTFKASASLQSFITKVFSVVELILFPDKLLLKMNGKLVILKAVKSQTSLLNLFCY